MSNIPQKNWLEWAVFALSAALILAVAGFLAYDAVAGDTSPPAIVLRSEEPVPRGELIEVPLVIENAGGSAAEDVSVAVTVRQVGGAEEQAELSVPLLPGHGQQEAVVAVPRRGEVEAVELRVTGYTLP